MRQKHRKDHWTMRLNHGLSFFILITATILLLIPVTVFSVLSSRSSTPQAATCYDLNGDGVVNQKDIDIVVAHFGAVVGDSNFDPRYDFDNSGSINVVDVGIIVSHEGETCPPTASFSASRTTINRGQSATLSWNTTRTNSVRINQGIGFVGKSGSISVSPSSSTTYTLSAIGPGGTVTKRITVSVIQPPPPGEDPPPDGGGPSGNDPTPPSSGPGNTSTVVPKPPPAGDNSITFLGVTVNQLKELSGGLSVNVSVSGTKFSANAVLTSFVKELKLELDTGILKQNKSYVLKIAGDKILSKSIKFKASTYKPTIKIGSIFLGDIDGNNKIDKSDISLMLNNFLDTKSDLNIDGLVNSLDYSIVLKNQGKKGN